MPPDFAAVSLLPRRTTAICIGIMSIDLSPTDRFADRHIGPSPSEIDEMLRVAGAESLDDLADQTIPASIRTERPLDLPPALTEHELLARAAELASRNQVYRSFIGTGYYDTHMPPDRKSVV